MKALRRYQELRPNEANPLDSMGDVNYVAGRLRGGRRLFTCKSTKKDPASTIRADFSKPRWRSC